MNLDPPPRLRQSYVLAGRELARKQVAAMRAIEGVRRDRPETTRAAWAACVGYLSAALRYGLSPRLNLDFWMDVLAHGWGPVLRECVRLSMSDLEEIFAEELRQRSRSGEEAN